MTPLDSVQKPPLTPTTYTQSTSSSEQSTQPTHAVDQFWRVLSPSAQMRCTTPVDPDCTSSPSPALPPKFERGISEWITKPITIGWNDPAWPDLAYAITTSVRRLISLVWNAPVLAGDLLPYCLKNNPDYLKQMLHPLNMPREVVQQMVDSFCQQPSSSGQSKNEIQLHRQGQPAQFYDALVDMIAYNMPYYIKWQAGTPGSRLNAFLMSRLKQLPETFDPEFNLKCFIRATAFKCYREAFGGRSDEITLEPNLIYDDTTSIRFVEILRGDSKAPLFRNDLRLSLTTLQFEGADATSRISDLLFKEQNILPRVCYQYIHLARLLSDISCGATVGNPLDIMALCKTLPTRSASEVARLLVSATYQENVLDVQRVGPVLANAYPFLSSHLPEAVIEQAIQEAFAQIWQTQRNDTILARQHPLFQLILLTLTQDKGSLDLTYRWLRLYAIAAICAQDTKNTSPSIELTLHAGSWHYAIKAGEHTLLIPAQLPATTGTPWAPIPTGLRDYLLHTLACHPFELTSDQSLYEHLAQLGMTPEALHQLTQELPLCPVQLRLQVLAYRLGASVSISSLLQSLATVPVDSVNVYTLLVNDLTSCLEGTSYADFIPSLESKHRLAIALYESPHGEFQRLGGSLIKQALPRTDISPQTIQNLTGGNPTATAGLLKTAWKRGQISIDNAWSLLVSLYSSASRLKYSGGALLDSALLEFAERLSQSHDGTPHSSSSSSSSTPSGVRSQLLSALSAEPSRAIALKAINIDQLTSSSSGRTKIGFSKDLIERQHEVLKPFLRAVASSTLSPKAIALALWIAGAIIRHNSLKIPELEFTIDQSANGPLLRIVQGAVQCALPLHTDDETVAELLKPPSSNGHKRALRPIDTLLGSITQLITAPNKKPSKEQRHVPNLIGGSYLSQLAAGASVPAVKRSLQLISGQSPESIRPATSSSTSIQPPRPIPWDKLMNQMRAAGKEPKESQKSVVSQLCARLHLADFSEAKGRKAAKTRNSLQGFPYSFFKKVQGEDAVRAIAFVRLATDHRRLRPGHELTSLWTTLIKELFNTDITQAIELWSECSASNMISSEALCGHLITFLKNKGDVATALHAHDILMSKGHLTEAYHILQTASTISPCKGAWDTFLQNLLKKDELTFAEKIATDHPEEFTEQTGPSQGILKLYNALRRAQKPVSHLLLLLATYPTLSTDHWQKVYSILQTDADAALTHAAVELIETMPPADVEIRVNCWNHLLGKVAEYLPEMYSQLINTPTSQLLGGIFPDPDAHPTEQSSFLANLIHTFFITFLKHKDPNPHAAETDRPIAIRSAIDPLLSQGEASWTAIQLDFTIAAALSDIDNDVKFTQSIDYFKSALTQVAASPRASQVSSSSETPHAVPTRSTKKSSLDPLIGIVTKNITRQSTERIKRFTSQLLECWQLIVLVRPEPVYQITFALALVQHGIHDHVPQAVYGTLQLLERLSDPSQSQLKKLSFINHLVVLVNKAIDMHMDFYNPSLHDDSNLTLTLQKQLWDPNLSKHFKSGERTALRARFLSSQLGTPEKIDFSQLLNVVEEYLAQLPTLAKKPDLAKLSRERIHSIALTYAHSAAGSAHHAVLCETFRKGLPASMFLSLAIKMLEASARHSKVAKEIIEYWEPIIYKMLSNVNEVSEDQRKQVSNLFQTYVLACVLLRPLFLTAQESIYNPLHTLTDIARRESVYPNKSVTDWVMLLLSKGQLVNVDTDLRAKVILTAIRQMAAFKTLTGPYACTVTLTRAHSSFAVEDYHHLYPCLDEIFPLLRTYPWTVNAQNRSVLGNFITITAELITGNAHEKVRNTYFYKLAKLILDTKSQRTQELLKEGLSLGQVPEQPYTLILAEALHTLLLVAKAWKIDTATIQNVLDHLFEVQEALASALYRVNDEGLDLWLTLRELPTDPQLNRSRARAACLWILHLASRSPLAARQRLHEAQEANWFDAHPEFLPDLDWRSRDEPQPSSSSSSSSST